MEGLAVRSVSEVWRALGTPMRQRRQFITTLACGAPQPAGYTAQDWHDWYAVRPLSETHMDAAVYQWEREFSMNDHARDGIDALGHEDTRRSKTAATGLRNGAFAA